MLKSMLKRFIKIICLLEIFAANSIVDQEEN